MLRKSPNPRADVQTHGAERGLDRLEGFSDSKPQTAHDLALGFLDG
jgi:hypothetical protein